MSNIVRPYNFVVKYIFFQRVRKKLEIGTGSGYTLAEMKSSLRNLNKKKRRAAILKAARHLFSRNGFDSANMDSIADMAEVARATLYNYFPSKESLLIGIAEEELEKIRQIIMTELAEIDDADKKLTRVLEVFILDSLPYINLTRKITYLNSREESQYYTIRLAMLEILEKLVLEGQNQDLFRRDIATADILDIIMGTYLSALYQWRGIEHYTENECRLKLRRTLGLTLQGIYSRNNGPLWVPEKP